MPCPAVSPLHPTPGALPPFPGETSAYPTAESPMSLGTIIHAGLTRPSRPVHALVLMGGGARTAYQVGVLQAMAPCSGCSRGHAEGLPVPGAGRHLGRRPERRYLASARRHGPGRLRRTARSSGAGLRSDDVYAAGGAAVGALQPAAGRRQAWGATRAGRAPSSTTCRWWTRCTARFRCTGIEDALQAKAHRRGRRHRLELHQRRALDLLPHRARQPARDLEPARPAAPNSSRSPSST